MGCLLWWWWRPDAKRTLFRSIWRPDRVLTVTRRPRLLPSSDIQERTFDIKRNLANVFAQATVLKHIQLLVCIGSILTQLQLWNTLRKSLKVWFWFILTAWVMVKTSQPEEWMGTSRDESSFFPCETFFLLLSRTWYTLTCIKTPLQWLTRRTCF